MTTLQPRCQTARAAFIHSAPTWGQRPAPSWGSCSYGSSQPKRRKLTRPASLNSTPSSSRSSRWSNAPQTDTAGADLALGVDHALPGYVGAGLVRVSPKRRQAEPDHARRAASHDLGDLAVGCHLAVGDLAHHVQDAGVHRRHGGSVTQDGGYSVESAGAALAGAALAGAVFALLATAAQDSSVSIRTGSRICQRMPLLTK